VRGVPFISGRKNFATSKNAAVRLYHFAVTTHIVTPLTRLAPSPPRCRSSIIFAGLVAGATAQAKWYKLPYTQAIMIGIGGADKDTAYVGSSDGSSAMKAHKTLDGGQTWVGLNTSPTLIFDGGERHA
jgi:hypothetical protein